jgi:hypothetical protein
VSEPGAGIRAVPSLLVIGAIALTLSLCVAATGIPERFGASIEAGSRIRAPETWTRGSRALLGHHLHEALVAADTSLPRNAVVLLVTPGRDILRSEYIAFHRALYVLAPRPVWWAAPAARDGSWESNWWTEIGPDSNASVRYARETGASHIVSLGGTGNVRIVVLDSANAGFPRLNEWREAPLPLRAFPAFAIILLAGWAVYAILSRRRVASLAETAAMSWLLGCGAVSLAMFWMIRIGFTPNTQRTSIGVAALAGSVVLIRRRRSVRTRTGSSGSGAESGTFVRILSAGLGIWLVAEIAGLIIRSTAGPLAGWDGWVTWAMKARVLHLQHDSAALLLDASREVSNRSYPMLLPLIESWFFGWVGAADDRFAAMVTMTFLVALVALLLSALRSRMTLVVALAIAVVFVTTPYAGLLAALGYADIVLAAYALATAIVLRRWLEDPNTSVALSAGVTGFLPWVKLEGIVLMVALLIGASVSLNAVRPRLRLAGSAAIAVLVCAGPWYLLVAAADLPQKVFSSVPDVTAQRVGEVITGLASRAVAIEWHGIWLALIAAIAIIAVTKERRAFLPVTVSLYVGALTAGFLFSSYAPLSQHLLRSGDRLLLHIAPLALLIVADIMASHRRASSATAEPRVDHR